MMPKTGKLLASLLLALAAALPLRAGELIMVEEQGCAWCARWNAEIAPIYPRTEEGARAPLRRVDLRETAESGIDFAGAVVFTPTFVLVSNGTELGRIEGYPGEDFFWGMLGQLLEKLPADQGPLPEEPT